MCTRLIGAVAAVAREIAEEDVGNGIYRQRLERHRDLDRLVREDVNAENAGRIVRPHRRPAQEGEAESDKASHPEILTIQHEMPT